MKQDTHRLKKKLHDQGKKVKLISTKRLTEDLINKYSILNGAKYFSSDELQNYLVFVSTRNIQLFSNRSKIYWSKSAGISEESIKIYLCQTIALLQSGLKIIRYQKTQINGNCLWQDSVSLIHKNVVTN